MVTTPEAAMSAPAVSASVTQTLRIGHGAVLRAIQGNTVEVPLSVLGTVRLPPLDSLVWFGGLATLTASGIMDGPSPRTSAPGNCSFSSSPSGSSPSMPPPRSSPQ